MSNKKKTPAHDGVYVPKACKHVNSNHYKDVCDKVISSKRRLFSVCEGCVESYLRDKNGRYIGLPIKSVK